MADTFNYLEKVGGRAPWSASFPRRAPGRSNWSFFVGEDGTSTQTVINTPAQLWAIMKEVGGFTQEHPDGIRINRTLPRAHPWFPWIFVEDIQRIQAYGTFTKIAADPGGILEAPTFDNVAQYKLWEFECSMTSRPYALAQDWDISTSFVTYNKPDGGTQNLNYAEEWLRYTDTERLPGGEYITAEAGQFKIDVASGQNPNELPAGSGQLRLFIPKPGIKYTWFEVPYSFVDTVGNTSRIETALGCINQRAWEGYGAGTLLFHAVAINRYTSWCPDVTGWDGSGVVFSAKKLCDISMIFLFLDPPLGKDAAGNPATPSAPVNSNAIQAGHNLVPLSHRNSWYYGKTVGVSAFADANDRPLYPSYPFEAIWGNPG